MTAVLSVFGYGGTPAVPITEFSSTEINLDGSSSDPAEPTVFAARARVSPRTSTYALTDSEKALDDLDRGPVRGRAILVP
ncbi:hypothetical protein [Amycolatopsis sp. NPDC051903]|uniref:hypothetical protein n=1 Tax=Amycolatopsis sp. NPDC051903 TaxID=3363936 RepID=UPI0037ABC625